MKFYKFILLLNTILLFISCNRRDFNFEFNKEGIKLNDIAIIPNSNYKCVGTYTVDSKPIASKYEIDKKISLVIVNLGKSKEVKFEKQEMESFDVFTLNSYGINDSYYDLDFYYNDPYDEPINTITLYSDGDINNRITNDSITEFDTKFHELAIRVNNRSDFGLYGKAFYNSNYKRDAKIAFYKKKNQLYVLIITPINKDGIIDKDLLLNYLKTNYK